MKVKFKKMHPDAKIPVKHYDDDFCYDLYATSYISELALKKYNTRNENKD